MAWTLANALCLVLFAWTELEVIGQALYRNPCHRFGSFESSEKGRYFPWRRCDTDRLAATFCNNKLAENRSVSRPSASDFLRGPYSIRLHKHRTATNECDWSVGWFSEYVQTWDYVMNWLRRTLRWSNPCNFTKVVLNGVLYLNEFSRKFVSLEIFIVSASERERSYKTSQCMYEYTAM